MKKLIDLSQPLFDGCPNCPAHPPVSSRIIAAHPGDGWQVELLTMATHSGCHVDAPLHKIEGAKSIDRMPLERFVGMAYIADLRGGVAGRKIDAATLRKCLQVDLDDKTVLLATGWGDRRAKTREWLAESPYLTPDGAEFLVEKKIRGVGIDHYTVGGAQDEANVKTHTILLSNEIWIVEELRFPAEVFAVKQPMEFWALPLNLPGASGAPARAVVVAE